MWPKSPPVDSRPGSLRRRLYRRVGAALAVVLVALGTLALRYADTASDRAFDHLLAASALTLAESLRLEGEAIRADIPAAAFAMLAQAPDDRVFYRLIGDDGRTITGYPDLPVPPPAARDPAVPQATDLAYKGLNLRAVAIRQLLTVGERPRWATVVVAQTQDQRAAFAWEMGGYAVLGLLVLAAAAAGMIALAIREALRPIDGLKQVLAERDPQDFTPLRQAVPEEIQPLHWALNTLLARFEASLTDTRSFLADATHQLRTPLASVIAQTEVTLRDASPAQRDPLLRILRNARASARIANQLLSDATISNRLELAPRALVPLARLAADIVNDRIAGAAAAVLRLYVSDDASAEACVLGDSDALADALRNLIDNALKYGPPQGPVAVTVTADTARVALTVRDHGPGLAPEDRSRVLRRFERGSRRLPADRMGGSGLGLAIVQRVVKAHHGDILLTDAPGGGLSVTISFPLAEAG